MKRNNNYTPEHLNRMETDPIPPRSFHYKKHHYVLGTLAAVVLLAAGAGGAYVLNNNGNGTSHKVQQESSLVSPNSNHKKSVIPKQHPDNSVVHKKTNDSSTALKNRPGYTLAVLPRDIQGTWYSYDEGKLETLTITANKIIENGQVTTVHARPKSTDASKVAKHNYWIVAQSSLEKVRGIQLVNTRGWDQTAGDGADYGVINTDGMTVLDLAGGADAETDANFYKSKQLAKQNKKKLFHGEKGMPD